MSAVSVALMCYAMGSAVWVHALQKALSLRREQADTIREAHGHFLARQRALAQQRGQALPVLQKALYSSCDLATHSYMGCAFSPRWPGQFRLLCPPGRASILQSSPIYSIQLPLQALQT